MSAVQSASETKLTKALLLDPNGEFSNWSQRLKQSGCTWDVFSIDDYETLISRLASAEYDAIFIAYDLKTSRKAELLRRAKKQSPATLRFQLGLTAESGDEKKVRQELLHRTFDTPTNFLYIQKTVEYLLKVRRILHKQSLQTLVHQRGHIQQPSYIIGLFEAVAMLGDSHDHIAYVLENDPLLSAQIIAWVNTPFFGEHTTVLGVKDLTNDINLRRLRGLIILANLYRTYPPHKNWQAFSFERLVHRSMLVAQLAYDIAKDAKLDNTYCEQSYLAGLLHDTGIMILASLHPAKYRDMLLAMEVEPKALHNAEKAIFGVFHGEAAAALLMHWYIPPRVMEAILFHSLPILSDDTRFTPLTAVHVADTLLPSIWKAGESEMRSQLSQAYLTRTAQQANLHRWKLLATEYRQHLRT